MTTKPETSPKTFKVMDRVTWRSSAAGSTTTKTGVVEAVVPAGRSPGFLLEKVKTAIRGASVRWGGGSRYDREVYIVRVDQGGKRKPALYVPRPEALEAKP